MTIPIFLFSLPRSGSTLIQKILMGHPDINSVAEPWLLLPFVYSIRKQGILAEYGHSLAFKGINDFISALPNQRSDYIDALREMALCLYDKQNRHSEKFFLDKTPRYHTIIKEIYETFPHAKFLFLFRQPHQIYCSIIQTWGKGRLNYQYPYAIDLIQGPTNLVEGVKLIGNQSLTFQYEDLINHPHMILKNICNYLEIDFRESMLENFSSRLPASGMGDQTGERSYQNIDDRSLNKWKETIITPFRKKKILDYVSNLNDDIFETQRYSKDSILNDILSVEVPNKVSFRDYFDVVIDNVSRIAKPNIWLGEENRKWAPKKFLY